MCAGGPPAATSSSPSSSATSGRAGHTRLDVRRAGEARGVGDGWARAPGGGTWRRHQALLGRGVQRGRSARGAWRGKGAPGLPGAGRTGRGRTGRGRGRGAGLAASPRRRALPPPPRPVPPLSARSGGGAGSETAAAQTHSQAGGVAPPGGDRAHPEGSRRPWDQVGRAVRPRAAGPARHAGFVARGLQSLGKTRRLQPVRFGALAFPSGEGCFGVKRWVPGSSGGLCPPGPLTGP